MRGAPDNGPNPWDYYYQTYRYEADIYAQTTLNVLNVNPTIELTSALAVDVGESFDLNISATDPGGANFTYLWDLDGDGIFELGGATQLHSFAEAGVHEISARVLDNEGGYADTTVWVTADAPFAEVPEPATLAIWSVLGFAGVGAARLRKRRKK